MPARLTLVNGVPTFEGGAYTGAVPGEFLAPKVEAREREVEPAPADPVVRRRPRALAAGTVRPKRPRKATVARQPA